MQMINHKKVHHDNKNVPYFFRVLNIITQDFRYLHVAVKVISDLVLQSISLLLPI